MCPLSRAKTCTIPVRGCRQNHLLLILCPQCEHVKLILWFCVKTFGRFWTFWLGWKVPPAIVAAPVLGPIWRFAPGVATWMSADGLGVETNDCSACHCLATLVETPDWGITLIKSWMYTKGVSTTVRVTSSVKSKWLKARINSLLKRGCKLEFSEQLEASRVDSAFVPPAFPNWESSGARSQPAQRQTNLPSASPSISAPARSCSNPSSALVISCSRSCMSALWYFPMLFCSFLPGMLSLALGESESKLDASCTLPDSGKSAAARSCFSPGITAQVKDSLSSFSRANFRLRVCMTGKRLVASVCDELKGTTLVASSRPGLWLIEKDTCWPTRRYGAFSNERCKDLPHESWYCRRPPP